MISDSDTSGFDWAQVGVYFGHYPAGGSVYVWNHVYNSFYHENYLSQDFGSKRNQVIYGQETPHYIDPKKIKDAGVPIALYQGKHDLLVSLDQTRQLKDDLEHMLVDYHEIKGGHLVFLVGKDISWFVDRAVPLIKKYNPV
jgi:hypothetical protein